LLFKEGMPEWSALTLGGDEGTLQCIISKAMFEGENKTIFRKSDFIFGDVAPDTDQQLLAGEGQWVYILDREWYYLPESMHHYPLSFFQ